MRKMRDISNLSFGRWIVLRFSHENERRAKFWVCKCACGSEKTVNSASLLNGTSQSCGCYMREEVGKRGKAATKHGMYKTTEYRIWQLVKARCLNSTNPAYQRYGGRGISICARWRDSFENFYADMGQRPVGMQLDRINNNKGYSKSNCRWADHVTQQSNRRDNRLITFHGKTQTMAAWGDALGISRATMYRRLQRWPLERALTEPPHKRGLRTV